MPRRHSREENRRDQPRDHGTSTRRQGHQPQTRRVREPEPAHRRPQSPGRARGKTEPKLQVRDRGTRHHDRNQCEVDFEPRRPKGVIGKLKWAKKQAKELMEFMKEIDVKEAIALAKETVEFVRHLKQSDMDLATLLAQPVDRSHGRRRPRGYTR